MSDDLDRYYLILGLEPGASVEDVRLAYRDSVDAWHPDRFSHAPDRQQRAEARLKQINDAYRKLHRQGRPSAERSAGSPRGGTAADHGSRSADE
ncbi:MAG: J domain-containing protein, partial [Actinomycetota bacterium]